MPSHQGEHVRPMTVAGLMRQAARYNAHQIAVMHGDRELSFIDAYERGIRMANGLLALGLNPGDRVAVLEDNSLESQDMFLGAALAGLVRVPLYARNAMASHV
ncbi:MAG: AMP-binding protein, partial [Pseudomonadales bacterium]